MLYITKIQKNKENKKMKKLASTILSALLLTSLLSSCALPSTTVSLDAQKELSDKLSAYELTIRELQTQINALESDKSAQDDENTKLLAELKAQLEELKQHSEGDTTTDTETGESITPGFKYIVSGDTATITGYSGEEKQLVIPASVDGYRVVSIADGAFENSDIKSVIISDGISSIGWFAFNGCHALKSITIPASVVEIGYSALGTAGTPATIYCHSDSFALSYAKSYGLTYTVI